MMEWVTMSKASVIERTQEYNSDDKSFEKWKESFRNIDGTLGKNYLDIRTKLKESYSQIKAKTHGTRSQEYGVDLEFGLAVYRTLKEYGFTARDSSNDEIWYHLQMEVIPDIILDRWPGKGCNINEERFWKNKRRIWIKILWWYIYLSLQTSDNIDELVLTRATLYNNQADDISQLVERAGYAGYRVEVYRTIMQRYGNIASNRERPLNNLLSRVLQLNIIRSEVVEPLLNENGVSDYVNQLFDYIGRD